MFASGSVLQSFPIMVVAVAAAIGGTGCAEPPQCNARPQPPSAPTLADAKPTGSTTVDVRWMDTSSNEAGLRIGRSSDSGASFGALAVTGANATVYVDAEHASKRVKPLFGLTAPSDGPFPTGAGARHGALPLAFEENRGQTDPQVRFLARGAGYTLFLTPVEAVLSLRGSQPQLARAPASERAAVVRMRLSGANTRPHIAALHETGTTVNYFVGDDPTAWRIGVPTYGRVRYRAVYPGIDLAFHGRQQQLEYDFVVAAGADPRRIALAFEGADRIELAPDGDLVLSVAGKEVRQRKPDVYQERDGVRTAVEGRYALDGRNRVRFRIADYDRARPLVIDPVLAYGTYLGGSAGGLGRGIAVDADGSAVIAGSTSSIDFPTVTAAQPQPPGGGDAFVAKLAPDGSRLTYSTYLGGGAGDGAAAVALDSQGSAYVTGDTLSADFPTTPGALGRTNALDNYTTFVAKLDALGRLAYSTYLDVDGGRESAAGIAVDGAGNALVAGTARMPFDYPYWPPPADAFVARIDPTGSALLSLVFLGGSDYDAGFGIAVDGDGNAYVTGTTYSIDFPVANAFQGVNTGFCQKAFISKVAPNGSLLYSTYLGGNWDEGYAIALDAADNIYVTGSTHDPDFPVTDPALWRCGDEFFWSGAFVAKLAAGGANLAYATTFSGWVGGDFGDALTVDGVGQAYVGGVTRGPGFPSTPDALQPDAPADYSTTGFIVRLDAAGSIAYASHLGGSGRDHVTAIALDATGNVYSTGWTGSPDFPVTAGVVQPKPPSSSTAFVTKISFAAPLPGSDTTPPDTAIASAIDASGATVPDNGATLSSGITFAFNGTDNVAVARFECRLDEAAFGTCASPLSYSGIGLGGHAFEVRAVDTSNNRDSTPARRSFTVDAPPDTLIASAIDGTGAPVANGGATLSNSVAFAFSGSDNAGVARFECRLDASSFVTCSSPASYAALGLGRHEFAVRAIDTSGFADPTPATYSVVVDSPPDTAILSAIDNTGHTVVNGGSMHGSAITFRFTGSDNTRVAGFECSFDGVAFAACTSPKTYSVAPRTHTFRVRAFDDLAFRDSSPAQFTWTR